MLKLKIMLKLKTKTQFNVPDSRGNENMVIIRMIASHCSNLDINNIKIEGYYYYLSDENDINSVVKIPNSEFGQSSMKQWSDITALENMPNSPLVDLCSTRNLLDVFLQRLKELTHLQMIQEAGKNWGTIASDWVEDTE